MEEEVERGYGAYFLFHGLLDSNFRSLELLIFICSSPAAGGKGRDEAAHGEEDGEAGEGNLPSRAAFYETEVLQENTTRFSCGEQDWNNEESGVFEPNGNPGGCPRVV